MMRENKLPAGVVLFVILILILFTSCSPDRKKVEPPMAKKIAKELTIHGDTRIDEYFWLRERENPEVIEYLNAENAYTESVMAHTVKFQKSLFDEIVGRIKQTDESVPYRLRGYFYYYRYEKGKEYRIHCRKKGSLEGAEEVMLDVNKMAEGRSYFAVRGINVSPNNKLVAYGVDKVSRRRYTLHFKNLETGEIYADKIPDTGGSVAWANDNETVFYALKDTVTLRPYKIMRHKLGTPVSEDRMVFHEADDTFNPGVFKTKSDRFIMIGSWQTMASEYRFLDADTAA